MRYNHTPVGWLKWNKIELIITSIGKDVKLVGLYFSGITFENPLALFTNGEHILPYDLEILGFHQTKMVQNKYPRMLLSV